MKIGLNAKKIINKKLFLIPVESESFPHTIEKIILAIALAPNKIPISVTLAPSERASKVVRIPAVPRAILKGMVAENHEGLNVSFKVPIPYTLFRFSIVISPSSKDTHVS